MTQRLGQAARFGYICIVLVFIAAQAAAAPYAAMVMDMRTGEVLYSRNADTKLHPASLTKMMTLYIAFEAIEHGEISLDTMITVSKNAAAEPPSKLGLRPGQRIRLRYCIRAAAVKSANDCATAIGEAIEGSESAWAARMNRTAARIGMMHTHFVNANGLTRTGHLSTAHDMTILGRQLFYDFPQYYNLFSRRTANAGGVTVANTNRRFLAAYRGADGIKTGYTRASGFNLVASAERGDVRIITTVFGGTSTAQRNRKVAELMDLGFRKAPRHAALHRPARPPYLGHMGSGTAVAAASGKTVRVVVAPTKSIRPKPRPGPAAPPETLVAALDDGIDAVVANVVSDVAVDDAVADALASASPDAADTAALADASAEAPAASPPPEPRPGPETDPAVIAAAAAPRQAPAPRPDEIILASVAPAGTADDPAPVVVERMSTSGGRHWGINVGRYTTQYAAEKVLLKTALTELATLGDALRKVARTPQGFDANFVGLTEDGAALACRRLEARDIGCRVIGPARS